MKAPFYFALLVCCACVELPTDHVAATYDLAQADGRPLPNLLGATINCDRFLVGGSLVLTERGVFTLTLDQEDDCSRAGGGTTSRQQTYEGAYIAGSGTIRLVSYTTSGGWQFEGTADGVVVTLIITDVAVSSSGALQVEFRRQ